VTRPETVQAVANAVNELPLAEPAGPFPSCPAMGPGPEPRVILTFRQTPRGAALAEVTTTAGFVCGRGGEASAQISTPGQRHRISLTDHLNAAVEPEGTSLADHIEGALEHRLHLHG
jgi:hypothetical protein